MRKLYFGSPKNDIKQIYKGKFLTSFKSIACCFAINLDDVYGQFNKKYTSINWGYDQWNKSEEYLNKQQIPKLIKITNNAKDWIKTFGVSIGYLYQIEVDEYIEKHLETFNDNDPKWQIVYNGNKKIPTKLIKEVKINWQCKYSKIKSDKCGFANIGGEKFQPPYSLDILKQKYPKLLKDEVHVWRAKNQIELIHKQPDFQEQKRIFYNWNLMPKKDKEISDKKSKRLFGMTNIQHHHYIMQNQWFEENYLELNDMRNRYNKKDMELNGWSFIHISQSNKPLTLTPRVPKNTMTFPAKYKQFNQDNNIARICASNSIFGAISALSSDIRTNDIYYVHLLDPKTIVNNSEVAKFVPDAISTGQVWILDDEIKTKVVAKITIGALLPYTYTFITFDNGNFCGNEYYDYEIELIG